MGKTIEKIEDYKKWYSKERPRYEMLSHQIEEILTRICNDKKINYHSMTARTKSINSFINKIKKGVNFDPKHMQDLAAIRVIVLVNSEVDRVSDIIMKNFLIDEDRSADRSNALGIDKVGYRSVHFVATLPNERTRLAEYKQFKGLFFEVQVCTILQHAWAQIGHDRNYKFSGVLPTGIKRRFSLLAGLLEMADNEFNHISKEIESYAKDVSRKAKAGELDISINSTSLRQYLSDKFKDIIEVESVFGPKDDIAELIINELKDMNIEKLSELEKITPQNYKKALKDIGEKTNFCGIIRNILIIHDAQKYFREAWKNSWTILTNHSLKLYSKFGIDFDKLVKKYELDVKA